MRLIDAHGSSKPRGRRGWCRDRTLAQSRSRVALKILRRSLRTLPSWNRQSMASQSGRSSGPFTVTVSNVPFGSGGLISISVQRLTCPRQRPFGPSHWGWYPASYLRRSTEGSTILPRFPVAFRPPAFACWASCPAEEFRSPHGRPTRQPAPGPRRGFHVPHIRVTAGLGALFTPRPSGALTAGPIPPAAARPSSRGQALLPRSSSHLPELSITRRHQGFTRVHPPGLPPRLVDPPDETGALGLTPRASHPNRPDLRRTPDRGTGIEHSPGVT